jgi:hypothetical protein
MTALRLSRGNSDFEFWWLASRLWSQGIDPYAFAPRVGPWTVGDYLFYPLPALILTWPVAWLPLWLAGALMLGIPSALLAYLLSAQGWWRLWIFATPSFVLALNLGQWSPMLTLAAISTSASVFAVAKPTLGLAVLAYRVSWRSFALAGALLGGSVMLMPSWPREWIANLAHVENHPAPILTLGGCWLTLAVLRWRTPEGRLLLAMAFVPQLLFFSDQLPLYLVARDRRSAGIVTLFALLAFLLWYALLAPGAKYVNEAAPYVLGAVYLPLLVLVLRRPNEGDLPPWLEPVASRLPSWLRGAPATPANV